jgi:dolichol-phosphate mannosyltransferase
VSCCRTPRHRRAAHGFDGVLLSSLESKTHAQTLTVVVPTYKEVANIPLLVERLNAVREQSGVRLDVLLMDDDSRDGSAELVEQLRLPWVKLITRTQDRGLSQAVLDGLRRSTSDVLVVMDADLSHPPEVLPQMLAQLEDGADFVVGSRFVEGGTTDDDWGLFRWLNSRVATLLAMPLTTIQDPMSGFFMLRRSTFEAGRDFSPVGYKIGLELYVKCHCRDAREVPIHFADRQFGESKLSLKEQLRYLRHIRRLYAYRFGIWSQLIQFLIVGASGLVVNLALLTVFLWLGVEAKLAVVLAIVLSMVWNFILNRRSSFSYARDGSIVRQFIGFVSACSVGAVVNYFITLYAMESLGQPQLAATQGVVAATGFNFAASRLVVFRQKHVVPKKRR